LRRRLSERPRDRLDDRIRHLRVRNDYFPHSGQPRPQATLAWMLIFFTAPIIGAVIYVLLGRERKALSKRSSLQMQNLSGHARPLLSPILSAQDEAIAALERDSPAYRKLLMLLRRNSRSALTRHNASKSSRTGRTSIPGLLRPRKTRRAATPRRRRRLMRRGIGMTSDNHK
jgi:Phospholipase_D-nuclease N-terminal